MSSLPPDQSEMQAVMTQPSPTTMSVSSSNTGAVIGAIVAVLCIAIVVALSVVLWYYFKRRKQTHSFHVEVPPNNDHAPSFRVLSTWEEAVTSQQKQKDASDYTPAKMGYSTPDLIAGTNDNDVIHNTQYGRLRNDTITSEPSNLPTIDEVSERPLSAEFVNPGFEMELNDILDPSLFNGALVLDGDLSQEEESDNERTLSKSPTDLDKDVSIIEDDLTNNTTIDSHNEEDDHVSTKESGLSDDLNVEIDLSQGIGMVNDTNSEDIENGLDNAGFEIDTDMEGNGTSSESPTASSDIDNSA